MSATSPFAVCGVEGGDVVAGLAGAADATGAMGVAGGVVIDATGSTAAIRDGLPRVAPGGLFHHFGVADASATTTYEPFHVYNKEITITGTMSLVHSFDRAGDLLDLLLPVDLRQREQAGFVVVAVLRPEQAGDGRAQAHFPPSIRASGSVLILIGSS